MAHLLYYRQERERHPTLHATGIAFEDAVEMIGRLAKEHEVEIRSVTRTSGRRSSCWSKSPKEITLNVDAINVLLVIHEFAHALDDKLEAAEQARWKRARAEVAIADFDAWVRRNPYPHRRAHTQVHADLVDALAKLVVVRGWISSIPTERAARDLVRQEKTEARAAHAADPAVVRAARIRRREEQVARLEAAIRKAMVREKALHTRLSRAKRSLAALVRAASKVEG